MITSLIRQSSKLILIKGKWTPISPLDARIIRRPGYNPYYAPPSLIPLAPISTVIVAASNVAPLSTKIPIQVPIVAVIEEEKHKKVPITLLGITLPLKPTAPAEGECCQSGCAHCTLDIYVEDLHDYRAKLSIARSAILAQKIEIDEKDWPKELGSRSSSSGEGEEENEDEAVAKEMESVLENVNPATKAFLEFEAKMKKKHKST